MSWNAVLGHDAVAERFVRAMERNRLASTFLFVGPEGVGKRTFALALAQALLCDRVAKEQPPQITLESCGECPQCKQAQAGTHPDILQVAKPADKADIPLALLIGEKEHRMRAGLCYEISLRPFSGRRKIALINDADYLNTEGANALLKTLEEPPDDSLLILIGTAEQRQLPTIRSRCQIVRFGSLTEEIVAELLSRHVADADPADRRRAAELAEGSIAQARIWLDPQVAEFRSGLAEVLAQGDFDAPALAKQVAAFVEGGGKESSAKRARLRTAIGLAERFFCDLLRRPETAESARQSAAECLELCLTATSHVDANAHQNTLIEWWLDELRQIRRSGAAI